MTNEEINDWIELNRNRFVGMLASSFGSDIAEVALQETCVKILANPDAFFLARNPGGWFYTIMRNECLDIDKKRRRERATHEYLLETLTGQVGLADGARQSELSEYLEKCFKLLDENERKILWMRFVDKMVLREISGELGVTPQAVSPQIPKLLKRMRRCLEERDLPKLSVK